MKKTNGIPLVRLRFTLMDHGEDGEAQHRTGHCLCHALPMDVCMEFLEEFGKLVCNFNVLPR